MRYNIMLIELLKALWVFVRLMPQNISTLLEPNTSEIIDRIKAIDAFIDAGYDVHINFSPVVVYYKWLQDYEYLFQMPSSVALPSIRL